MDSTNSEPVNVSLPGDVRELPHNIDIEQALLGALLLNNSVLEVIDGLVATEDFYELLHQKIWVEITETIQRGHTADPVILSRAFEDYPPITPKLTVPQYLGSLAANATSIMSAASYARTIHDLAVRRNIITLADVLRDDAHNAPPEVTGEMQIAQAESYLASIAENGNFDKTDSTFAVVLQSAMDYAHAAYERGGGLAGLSTGLVDVDRKLGGLAPGNLIILAGRPSMGKTALATNIATYNALKWLETGGEQGARVKFFSLEMSEEELGMRVLGQYAEIPSDRIRRGDISEDDLLRLAQVKSRLDASPFFVDQEGGLPISRLAARARRSKRRDNIGLLVVDYLQLMQGSGARREGNRVLEVTEITMGLKALAKELGIPIIALSQLSRKVEERADKRPQLSDLRESGSIEQDADVVMFVFREEYYLEREKPPAGDFEAQAVHDARMREVEGKAEVIIGKQRHGSTGSVPTAFNGELTQFSNLAPEGI